MMRSTSLLYAWMAAHAATVAVVAAVIAISAGSAGGRLLALGLLALVSGVAMLRRSALTAATTGAAVIAYVVVRALEAANAGSVELGPYLPGVGAGAIGLVAAAVVSDLLAQFVQRLEAESSAGRRVIADLERVDFATGLFRSAFGLDLIEAEVARGGLHGRDCSLVLLGLDQSDEAAEARAGLADEELMRRLAEAYRAKLSAADYMIARGEDILVLLVETGAERGELVAAQLCEAARAVIATPVRAGVASFPVSEVTAEGLIAEAEASLSFARAARVPVAGPELLQS